jgi:hypothetical protein
MGTLLTTLDATLESCVRDIQLVLSANGQRDESQRLDVGSSVPSQKRPFVGRRKRRVGNLRYWNSKSAERERSAEKLLGSRERVGKQVLFCSGSTEILCLEGGGRTKYGSTGTDVMVFGRSGWCSDVGEVTSG